MQDDLGDRARRAGLDRAWRDFPEEVRAAMALADAQRAAAPAPGHPATEPWPPMRVAGT